MDFNFNIKLKILLNLIYQDWLIICINQNEKFIFVS